MIEEEEYYLKKFYDKLYDTCILRKKLKEGSIIKTFFEIKSTERFKLLKDSSIQSYKIQKNIFDNLLAKNYIQSTEELDSYIITAKGIWDIEKKGNKINEDLLIEYLNSKFYNFKASGQKLKDREKIIILSMIAARTFSEKSPVDLKRDDIILDSWKDILDLTCEKLISIGVIKTLDKDTMYGSKTTEHPVSNLIRHTDDLPKKTRGLFVAAGKQKYYLDLYNDNKLNKENLSYLFWLIFCDNYSNIIVSDIVDFCNKIAFDKGIYVFNLKDHEFSNTEFNPIIRDSLMDSIILKNKWENNN